MSYSSMSPAWLQTPANPRLTKRYYEVGYTSVGYTWLSIAIFSRQAVSTCWQILWPHTRTPAPSTVMNGHVMLQMWGGQIGEETAGQGSCSIPSQPQPCLPLHRCLASMMGGADISLPFQPVSGSQNRCS